MSHFPFALRMSPLPLLTRLCSLALSCAALVLSAAQGAAQTPYLGDAPTRSASKSAGPDAVVAADALRNSGGSIAADLTAVDVSNRESVRQFYLANYLSDVAIGWTGSMTDGTPGTTSAAFKDRVLLRLNFFRALAGLPSGVTLDSTFNTSAQAAALMMSANGALSHTPPNTWKFYSAEGAAAAGKSNLALGLMGAAAIEAYMDDFGANNAAAGHRRWILHPKLTRVGTGDVPTIQSPLTWAANALLVLDGVSNSATRVARDGYVAWPYPGYIPYRFISARFSVSHPNADFSNSVVTATLNGAALDVTVEERGGYYGEGPAIVFNLTQGSRILSAATLTNADYDKPIRIQISNTRINNQLQTIDYTVIPFDPNTSGPTATAPTLTLPASLTATVGQAYSYQVSATGATSYSATGLPPGLSINTSTGIISGTPTSAGSYNVTVTASNTLNTSKTVTITVQNATVPTPPPTGTARLINLSTRSRIGSGQNIMIAGFVIEGTENKTVLIRGIGPSLKQFGITDAAGSVILRLNNGQQDIATNQGWSTSTDAASIISTSSSVGAFPLDAGSGDSVILKTLPAGAYTALLSTPAGKEGVGLAEVYEVNQTGSRLINISTRAEAGADSATMIAGIVVQGTGTKKLLVRAVGRSLGIFGLTGTIAKPQIQLVSGSTTLGTAGAWGTAANAAEISAAFSATGAFPLEAANEDAATVVTLPPGNYTALVTATPGTSNGLCLIEAYELKQ